MVLIEELACSVHLMPLYTKLQDLKMRGEKRPAVLRTPNAIIYRVSTVVSGLCYTFSTQLEIEEQY